MNLNDSETAQALSIQADINSYKLALLTNKSDTYTIADELRERLELD